MGYTTMVRAGMALINYILGRFLGKYIKQLFRCITKIQIPIAQQNKKIHLDPIKMAHGLYRRQLCGNIAEIGLVFSFSLYLG